MEHVNVLKKVIILLFLCISLPLSSQTINFKTISFAEKEYNYSTQSWEAWSSWEDSNMLLTIDMSNDIVTIYSPKVQIYQIYSSNGSYYDDDDDLHVLFKFVDQDGDNGTMRLLQRTSGSSEIYIEFSNIKWCYRVIQYEF